VTAEISKLHGPEGNGTSSELGYQGFLEFRRAAFGEYRRGFKRYASHFKLVQQALHYCRNPPQSGPNIRTETDDFRMFQVSTKKYDNCDCPPSDADRS
jgi:hypothetical protein